jgi:hypothetical protein
VKLKAAVDWTESPVEGPRVLRRSCPVACRAPFGVGGEHVAEVGGRLGR